MAGPHEQNYVGAESLLRGDTWLLASSAVAFDDGLTLETPGVVLRSTIKRHLDDPDPGLAQVNSAQLGGITVLSTTTYLVAYLDTVTAVIEPGRYHYDVVIDFSPVHSETLEWGVIDVIGDATRTTL